MAEIDQTDLLGFLRIRAWNAKREHEQKKPQPHHIDEVWPNLKP